MRKLFLLLALLGSTVAAVPVLAENTRQEVRFPSGATGTVINGALRGQDVAEYILRAGAGQTMTVNLSSDRASTFFNVTPPGGNGLAMFNGSVYGAAFQTSLPGTGAYVISVYQLGQVATAGRRTTFQLDISITGRAPAAAQTTIRTPVPGQTVPGNVVRVVTRTPGGFVTVAGLAANDTLNIRSGPSTRDPVLAAVSEGRLFTLVQCLTTAGQEWCQVTAHNDPGLRGWAAGRYLVSQ